MQIKQSWHNPLFWVSFLLFFINWGIESIKWQILIRPLEKFSFITAFKSVLAGCSVTMLTPNRVGEYGGRILYVKQEFRIKAVSLTILGSISQLLVTIIMGTTGLILMKYFSLPGSRLFNVLPGFLNESLIWFSVIFSMVLILTYFRIGWFINLAGRIRFLRKVSGYIGVLNVFSSKQLLRILLLSVIRYLVFILQYILLLEVMEVGIGMILSFWLLSVFYLIMAIAPTIGFIELPVRAAASVELLKLYSSNILGIQAATLGIWLINLVLPAIVGSLLILGINRNNNK